MKLKCWVSFILVIGLVLGSIGITDVKKVGAVSQNATSGSWCGLDWKLTNVSTTGSKKYQLEITGVHNGVNPYVKPWDWAMADIGIIDISNSCQLSDISGWFEGYGDIEVKSLPRYLKNMDSAFKSAKSVKIKCEIPNKVVTMQETFKDSSVYAGVLEIPASVTNMDGCFKNATLSVNTFLIATDKVTSSNGLIDTFSGCNFKKCVPYDIISTMYSESAKNDVIDSVVKQARGFNVLDLTGLDTVKAVKFLNRGLDSLIVKLPDTGDDVKLRRKLGISYSDRVVMDIFLNDEVIDFTLDGQRLDMVFKVKYKITDTLYNNTWYVDGSLTVDRYMEYDKLTAFDLSNGDTIRYGLIPDVEASYNHTHPSDFTLNGDYKCPVSDVFVGESIYNIRLDNRFNVGDLDTLVTEFYMKGLSAVCTPRITNVKFHWDGKEEKLKNTWNAPWNAPKPEKKDGYDFDGWYTTSTYVSDSKINLDRAYTNTNIEDVYGRYLPKTKTIGIIIDDKMTPLDITFDEVIPLPNTPSKYGYTFDGWVTDKGVTIENGAKFTDYSLESIEAVFSPLKQDIVYDYGGVQVTKTQTFNMEFELPATDPVKEGYVFDGWFDNNGNEIHRGDKWIDTSVSKISAKFTSLATPTPIPTATPSLKPANTPNISTSTPDIGTSTPGISTSTPDVGTSTPDVGTSTEKPTPDVGTGTEKPISSANPSQTPTESIKPSASSTPSNTSEPMRTPVVLNPTNTPDVGTESTKKPIITSKPNNTGVVDDNGERAQEPVITDNTDIKKPVVKLSKPSIRAKRSGNKIKVTIKGNTKTYEVWVSKSKKFKGKVKKYTIKGYKKKVKGYSRKVNYIRVRSYIISGGKKSYSRWSKVRHIKLK